MSTHNRNVTLRRGVGIRLLLPAGITMCGWRLTVVLHQISEIRRKACVSCEPFARFQRSGDSIRTFSLSIVRSDPSLLGREPFRGEFSCGTGVSPVQRVQDTPRMEARTNAGVSSLFCGVLLTGGAPVPHQAQSPHAPIPALLDHAPQDPRQKNPRSPAPGHTFYCPARNMANCLRENKGGTQKVGWIVLNDFSYIGV